MTYDSFNPYKPDALILQNGRVVKENTETERRNTSNPTASYYRTSSKELKGTAIILDDVDRPSPVHFIANNVNRKQAFAAYLFNALGYNFFHINYPGIQGSLSTMLYTMREMYKIVLDFADSTTDKEIIGVDRGMGAQLGIMLRTYYGEFMKTYGGKAVDWTFSLNPTLKVSAFNALVFNSGVGTATLIKQSRNRIIQNTGPNNEWKTEAIAELRRFDLRDRAALSERVNIMLSGLTPGMLSSIQNLENMTITYSSKDSFVPISAITGLGWSDKVRFVEVQDLESKDLISDYHDPMTSIGEIINIR